jgi:hypothetical protein
MYLYLKYCEYYNERGDEAQYETHIHWCLEKCLVAQPDNQFDVERMEVQFEPKLGQTVYVVYVRYDDGETSGVVIGKWRIIKVCDVRPDIVSIVRIIHRHKYAYEWTGYWTKLTECSVKEMVIT